MTEKKYNTYVVKRDGKALSAVLQGKLTTFFTDDDGPATTTGRIESQRQRQQQG